MANFIISFIEVSSRGLKEINCKEGSGVVWWTRRAAANLVFKGMCGTLYCERS